MLLGSTRMKCGHPPDCIMSDVPYNGNLISLEACSFCFDNFGTAIQPACNVNTEKLESLPRIERTYGKVLIGGITVVVLSILILIASVNP